MKNKTLFDAIAFANAKHEGQLRRDGTPYIYHPFEVARIVKDAGYDERYQIVALLHDVLEDTDATEFEVSSFGDDVLEAVKLLTRGSKNEGTYVADILKNHMSTVVKNADKMQNLYDCVYCGDGERTGDEKAFARKYIEKAKKYYKGKFSKALDKAITTADSKQIYFKTQPRVEEYNRREMELYVDREKQLSKENFLKYQNNAKPEFDEFGEFYIGDKYHPYIYISEREKFSTSRNYWLTKYGWEPVSAEELMDDWDDFVFVDADKAFADIKTLIRDKFFYDFVKEDRIL